MSWRDDSSSSTNGTQDGSGGSMSGSGSVSGTGGGGFGGMGGETTGSRGGYTFSGVPGTRNIGNWNTGGPAVGFGSVGGGINPLMHATPLGGPPMRATQPLVPPVVPPPVQPPVYPPVSGPPNRVDLNPATLAPWTGSFPSVFQSLPSMPSSNLFGYGPPGGGKYQDRLDTGGGLMNSGFGNTGGGFGGGGGGGW